LGRWTATASKKVQEYAEPDLTRISAIVRNITLKGDGYRAANLFEGLEV
jgi:hypothetical protein